MAASSLVFWRSAFILLLVALLPGVSQADLSDTKKKILGTAAVVAKKLADKEDDASDKNGLKLASVDITGVDGDLKKNVELHMPVTIPECQAERAEVAQFFSNVKKNLRRATRALGYYDAEFRSGGSVVDGCWKLRLTIDPGKPVKVVSQTIDVTGPGKTEKVFTDILKTLPYETGDILNHQHYTDFKTKLAEAAQQRGYFDAEFVKRTITVSPEIHQARIALVLDTGKQYRYGDISVDQDVLTDARMQRYILLKTGEPYNTEDLLKQQQFLQQTDYYKTIKIDVLHDQAQNNQVPVSIKLERKKRKAYIFKVGYGSDTGARISGEMDRRWTGKSGKKLKLKAQYSEKLSGFSAQLISPRKNPQDDNLVYNFKIEEDANNDVVSRSLELSGDFTRKRKNGWIQFASIGLLFDETKVEGQDSNATNLLLFGVGLEKTKSNHPLYPTRGWHLKFEANTAIEKVLSDQSILRLKATGKRLHKIGDGHLLASVTLGTVLVDQFDDLPKKLRFFAGGSNSVRGYGYETLGDLNSDGAIIGGKHLITTSLEYQHPINDDWSAAVFVDAGNAFSDWGSPDLKMGGGLGARWRSPVGPVRIDVGFPEFDFKAPHLHLSVGADL